MNRAQLEALIADYLDGVLAERDAAEFEKYLPLYPDLAELVQDAGEGMRLLGQVDAPEPPARSLRPHPVEPGRSQARGRTVKIEHRAI